MKISVVKFCSILLFSFSFPVFSPGGAQHTQPPSSLAIFDFTDSNGEITEEGEKLSLLIFSKLAKDEGLRLIERSEFEKIMKEQDLSQSSLANPDSSLKLGRLLGADNILTGKIFYMDEKLFFNGKLIDCRTAKISGVSLSFDVKKNTDSMLEDFSKGISDHILNQLKERRQADH